MFVIQIKLLSLQRESMTACHEFKMKKFIMFNVFKNEEGICYSTDWSFSLID
jgi:hypothetical protein